jgi:hypothetical protein
MAETPKAKSTTAKSSGAIGTRKAAKTAAPWTFPKNTLEETISVAKAIEEQNAGNPMKADLLVKAVGFKKSNDWRFLDLLRSASQYGLVSGTGQAATVTLEKIGQDIVAPGAPQDRQQALSEAFRNVEDFRKVEDFYRGKRLPEDEFFENNLVREFKIPRERVGHFMRIFTANINYLRAFKAEPRLSTKGEQSISDDTGETKQSILEESTRRTRTFLDTCFVMMPFGHWFDVYYKDIFVPAIKEAGLEPVRADELFYTGSVIEQIWEQISKAKILLADLSGKNANVFYELGLAHAATKPVVFTAASLEDVPFDLRHLRVVIYDVQNPFWGNKLMESITAYLKAAKNDPDKSVPQPFRRTPESGDES